MSDTRAAIRELRSLSEKRSQSALTEDEAARWMALRRQLGLPLEPVNVLESAPPARAGELPATARSPTPASTSAVDVGALGEPASGAPVFFGQDSNQALPEEASEEAPEETHWTGPSLDSPTAPVTSAWVGPALDAPAWSDAAADRPTDPGLDGPPPAPFDEAPAATRPPKETDAADFGGSPADRVPLAAAADFVSYGREGDEAIDLPEESGRTEVIEQHTLAQLSYASPSEATPSAEYAAVPSLVGDSEEMRPPSPSAANGVPDERPSLADRLRLDDEDTSAAPTDSLQLEAAASSVPGVYEGVVPEDPFPPEATESPASGVYEGVAPEDPFPPEATESPASGVYEGVAPEDPFPARATESPASGVYEGVVTEDPLPLESAASSVPGVYEGVMPEDPLPLESAASSVPVYEGVLPEDALPLEAAAPPASGVDEGFPPAGDPPLGGAEPESPGMGVLFEPPLAADVSSETGGFAQADVSFAPSESAAPETLAEPALDGVFPTTPAPLQLGTPLSHAHADDEVPQSVHSGLAGPPVELRPPVPSTWEPGSAEPPLVAADDFARGGEPIGGRGLDPWPEETSVETEDVVETVGDDDLVEDLSTPTPEPLRPMASPPGSGGIRGFQFPKPPAGGGPTPAPWQRTDPGVPAFVPQPAAPAPIPVSSLSASTPAPRRPVAAVVPVPPAPPQRSVTPTAAVPRTLTPSAAPARPAAPVTPEPPTPRAVEPARAPPRAFQLQTPAPEAVGRSATPVLEEEAAQPVLELVDEVEPAQAPVPVRSQPAPSPVAGTPAAIFGAPMMLNPNIVEGDHRVVVHTLEGQVHRGTVHDLDLQDNALAVQQPDGRSVQIPTKRVKAVFFVLAPGGQPLPTRGERVQVTFQDGRQVVGYSDDHATGEPGFFVVPSDARTNTARVYVFRGGVQSITTG